MVSPRPAKYNFRPLPVQRISEFAALVNDRKVRSSILRIAVPDRIIPHGAPNLLHAKYGLDIDGIVERIKKFANEFPARSEVRYRSLLRP